jgi:hypothetical protein
LGKNRGGFLGLREISRRLSSKHGHVTVPVLLGILFLVTGLGHAYFNPPTVVDVGVLELVAGVLLFVGALLASVRRTRAPIVCFGNSAGCVCITVIMHVGVLIRQVSR